VITQNRWSLLMQMLNCDLRHIQNDEHHCCALLRWQRHA
jgi:hypothetical protein